MSKEQEVKKVGQPIVNAVKKTGFGKPMYLGGNRQSEVSPERLREATENGGIAVDWALLYSDEMLHINGTVRKIKDLERARQVVNDADKECGVSPAQNVALAKAKDRTGR